MMDEPMEKFLLDTNAYFNYLKGATATSLDTNIASNMQTISVATCYISAVTKIEIISVIGKYARGTQGGKEKCVCVISEAGEICHNHKYYEKRTPLKKREIKAWLKLVKETIDGSSPVLKVSVLPITARVLDEAERVILHALSLNFGSLDAVIAATALVSGVPALIAITSDKGLKACMNICSIPVWDAFKVS